MWAGSEQTKKRNICSTLSRDLIKISKCCCASVTKAEIPGQVFQKLTETLATNLTSADLTNPWGFFLVGVGFPNLGTDQGLSKFMRICEKISKILKKVNKDYCRDGWESKTKTIEDGILARVMVCLSLVQSRDSHLFMNGTTKPNGQGLVTPPSPCSLSSGSMQPRSRKNATDLRTEEPSLPARSPHPRSTQTLMGMRNMFWPRTMVLRLPQGHDHVLLGRQMGQVTRRFIRKTQKHLG